jgi:hypothetical protein
MPDSEAISATDLQVSVYVIRQGRSPSRRLRDI